eukprot:1611594-Rhodomonas_salina.1
MAYTKDPLRHGAVSAGSYATVPDLGIALDSEPLAGQVGVVSAGAPSQTPSLSARRAQLEIDDGGQRHDHTRVLLAGGEGPGSRYRYRSRARGRWCQPVVGVFSRKEKPGQQRMHQIRTSSVHAKRTLARSSAQRCYLAGQAKENPGRLLHG